MSITFRICTLGAVLLGTAALPALGQSYHLVRTDTLGGEGGWDYLALDTAGHRLFIARQNRVMVVDPATGKLLVEIPGLDRAHGIAFAYAEGHGFATSGEDSTVTMFDLATLKVLGHTTAAPDDDAILYDPATHRVFTFNGDSHSATVIDASTGQRVGTIDLGAGPEFGVSAGDGKLYVNLETTSEVAEIDAATMKVTRRWPIAPCESPSGLAIDRAHHLLFSGCRSKVMGISDATTGKLVTTVPIGAGVDACRFDPATGLAFASNGEGTLTVIHEDSPVKFTVVANVTTKRGARTMELDERTHRVYTATADFGPPPPPTPGEGRPRFNLVPGSFALLVLDPLPAGVAAAQQPTAQDTTHKRAYTREVPDSLSSLAKIQEDSARALALHRVPGGTVQALELEREHGKLIWSFDIKVAGKPGITEVNVSALDGSIIGVGHEAN